MAKRVVVVDDYPEFLALMREVLSPEGYHVATTDGRGDVIQWLRERRPDLLILDLLLEGSGGGWDILAAVRREPGLATLRVLVCTADTVGLKARAIDLQRYQDVAVLTKPFHVAEMRDLVQRLAGPAREEVAC